MIPTVLIRRIAEADNAGIASVIRRVSAEYGLTADKGYTVADPQLDALYGLYQQPRSAYWVIILDGEVAGGGGVAPLSGGDSLTCELQKMYFLPTLRGTGLAQQLADRVFAHAHEHGFTQCYLETTGCLHSAIGFYEKLGFNYIDHAMGSTGHVDCEVRMLKTL